MCLTHVRWQPIAQASFPVARPNPQPGRSRLTHGGDGLAVGQETEAVLEDAAAMEERKGDTHDLLQPVLDPAQPGAGTVLNLVKDLILPEGEDWHQSCPGETQARIRVQGPTEGTSQLPAGTQRPGIGAEDRALGQQ